MNDKILICGLIAVMAGSGYLVYSDCPKEHFEKPFQIPNWEESPAVVVEKKQPPASKITPSVPGETIVAKDYSEALSLAKQKGKPVILFFSTDWCNWCKKMKSETLPKVDKSKYIFCEIDADKNPELVKKYGVQFLPSYFIINGKEEKLKEGSKFMDADNFTKWLDNPSFYEQEKINPDIEVKPDSKPILPPPKKIIPQPRKWLQRKWFQRK